MIAPLDLLSRQAQSKGMENESAAFQRLYGIITKLRGPGGCPWDLEQTPLTLRSDLIEETYECVEAIDEKSPEHIREELGDLFLLTTMLAYMHEQEHLFSVSDALNTVSDKLIRRHPHVFGDVKVQDSGEALANWARIKVELEGRAPKDSILDEVSQGLPPLDRAYKLQKKAAKAGFDRSSKAGFDRSSVEDAAAKVRESLEKTMGAATGTSVEALEEELGELLFSAVNLCRHLKIEPSVALRRANGAFTKRFKSMERRRSSMGNIKERFAGLGIAVPEIIMPCAKTDLERWAVIACDQFTQDEDYWERMRQAVGGAASTLNLVFPEVYLNRDGREQRIREIHQTMKTYLEDGTLGEPRRSCVYVERATPYNPLRRGVLLAIDLEQYDWKPDSRLLVRATEGTVAERLPPRMEIRRGAPLEVPHILLLIDDEGDTLLPALGERIKAAPLYRTPLMRGAGSVTGWALDSEADLDFLAGGLEDLARRANSRYGCEDSRPFLFAVGDGNHSLAAAKAVWEEYKANHQGESLEHPARWALAEVENLYDPGIVFEPIHRLLFGAELHRVLSILKAALPGFTVRVLEAGGGEPAKEELSRLVGDGTARKNRLGFITETELVFVEFTAPGLAVNSLQPLLDSLVKDGAAEDMDYIHDEEALFRISRRNSRTVGILLPPFNKKGLFETAARGPLPRKSFSMGKAVEKRFYLECRSLFPIDRLP
ncbi:MAG: nucleoside triphosphate pyrophosphohydrolase [Treponema sp.]|jgi:MazG family protein|nr:nucleoside triphosphate pyrophosphohydrolase [Treponema sp.]